MNRARWGVADIATVHEAGISYENAVKYLKNWIIDRTAYMDTVYGPEPEQTGE